MQPTKSTLPRTLLGKAAAVRSIRRLTLCLVLLVWAGPALGAKLRVPSVKYPTIQAAIDQAQPKDDIEVAPGTYYENIDFHGKAVRLYGREGAAATTIDGGGNGSVVTCASGETVDTVLEGFTITGGSAEYGGGMYNYDSSPTVAKCTFSSNWADLGGSGMFNRYGSPAVANCTFSDNSAVYEGGMFNWESSPTVTNCTFNDNSGRFGGGMANDASSPMVTNCTFSGNAAEEGGGIGNWTSSPTVTHCTFTGNAATQGGGGMNNCYGSSPTVTNCTFTGNGGGFFGAGGGMYNLVGNPTVTNCTFTDNTASYGGGMANNAGSPVVTNCSFSSNYGDYGGGLYSADSNPTMTNCILWSDSGGEIFIYPGLGGWVTITYSDIQGGFPGEGNIDADPLLDDAGHLQVGSPCIDAGSGAAVPDGVTTDLDGDRRIRGTSVDMGAYESSYKAKKTNH